MEQHERALEAHGRAMERSNGRVRVHAMSLMTLAPAPARDEVLFDRTFRFRAGDRLAVGLSSEDVVVETARGSEARVRVIGDGRDARSEFEHRRFEANYDSGTLRVRTNPGRRTLPRRVQASFRVVIEIPVEAQLDVATSSGDIRIVRNEGRSASISTSSGDIALGTIRADRIEISASSGDVTADALDGAVQISTSSGDVTLARVAGRSVTVNASSGDINIRRAESARLSASTSSGNVSASGVAGASRVATGSGDVELVFARASEVQVQTGSGEVSLAFPRGAGANVNLAGPDVEIDGSLAFEGSRERRSVRGRIGGGGPAVTVSTGAGGIELAAR
jgi:hypothetical protein